MTMWVSESLSGVPYHMGGLNNRHLYPIVVKSERFRIKVPEEVVPGEHPLPDL